MTAMVYGCEVDYAVVEPGDLPPEIVLQPRQPGESACDPRGTYMITTGRAPRKMPIVDFGNLPLQRAKVTHVVLYNRTGIATPFRALLVVVFFGGGELESCSSKMSENRSLQVAKGSRLKRIYSQDNQI